MPQIEEGMTILWQIEIRPKQKTMIHKTLHQKLMIG
jgi:hypothetical protein